VDPGTSDRVNGRLSICGHLYRRDRTLPFPVQKTVFPPFKPCPVAALLAAIAPVSHLLSGAPHPLALFYARTSTNPRPFFSVEVLRTISPPFKRMPPLATSVAILSTRPVVPKLAKMTHRAGTEPCTHSSVSSVGPSSWTSKVSHRLRGPFFAAKIGEPMSLFRRRTSTNLWAFFRVRSYTNRPALPSARYGPRVLWRAQQLVL
jgi:hypothetical protein